ncbi:MAG: phosphatidate cytidylyltransferase [Pedobacter sp.]|nr:MAG: phosphatidate cytidylyltransferase [Pedobacter sp.]
MKTRAITAFFFTIVMLASMFLGSLVFSIFFLLLSLVCLAEFYSMLKITGIKTQRGMGILIGLLLFGGGVGVHLNLWTWEVLLLMLPVFFSPFIIALYQKQDKPFENLAYTYLGLLFTTLPFLCFYALGFLLNGVYEYTLVLGFLLLLWANDTGAYLFGMKWGKNKLFERHSPKKSWEGFLGGIFTALVVAFIMSNYFPTGQHPAYWMGMALIISIIGTLGDLVESMLKRSLNVKDSGTFLPGHGGFLDRFDGLFMSAPVVLMYWHVITHY